MLYIRQCDNNVSYNIQHIKTFSISKGLLAAWAREHYRLHHGGANSNNNVGTEDAIKWSPPAILGHHHHHHPLHPTIPNTTMTPLTIDELLEYYDNKSADRENLRNLSGFDPPFPPT